MKTLVLVRHAKSSWDPAVLSDFDRTLNERGKADAPEMARKLKQAGIVPDLLVSSSAKRARKTARLFAEQLGMDKDAIQLVASLYEPTRQAFLNAVLSLPADRDIVALFSHNPGITDFANSLSSTQVDDMPTCAMFAVTVSTDDWADFQSAEKKFLFFKYPKLQE